MSHRRHLDPMIEAAYQRRLALRGERTFVLALLERYERNDRRRDDAPHDPGTMIPDPAGRISDEDG